MIDIDKTQPTDDATPTPHPPAAFEVCRELSEVLRAHRLRVEEPYVTNGRIELGEIDLPTATRLADLLGAPRDQVTMDDEATGGVAYFTFVQHIADLLRVAVHEITGTRLDDVEIHYDCSRCQRVAGVTLGCIQVEAAQRLVTVLRQSR